MPPEDHRFDLRVGITYRTCVDSVVAYIRPRGLRDVTLVGHRFGGSVIQKVEELPERQKGSSKQVPIGTDGRRASGDPTVLRIGSDPGRRFGAAAGGASRPSCTSARRPDRAVSA